MPNLKFDFAGKVAVVTGGAGAIGLTIVKKLAEAGAKVAAVDIASTSGFDEKPYQDRIAYFKTNIIKPAEVKETVEKIMAWAGKIDILINTAGVFRRSAFVDTSEADIDIMMDVNVKGMYLMTQAVTPHFIKQCGGKIVNFASTAGVAGSVGDAAYCASKGAVVVLTKAIALELAPHKINVNAVSPNGVDNTPMMAPALAVPGERERRTAKVPLGRLVQFTDIVQPVLFLCSDAADMITGINLYVDGGFLA